MTMPVYQFRKFARPTTLGDIDDPQTWDAVADAPEECPDDYIPRGTKTRQAYWFAKVEDEVEPEDGGITAADKLKFAENATRTVLVDGVPSVQEVARKRYKLDVPNLRAELPKATQDPTEMDQKILDIIQSTDPEVLYDYEENGVPILPRALLMRHLQDKTKAVIRII
jgi:hypothetical protein